MAEGFRVGDIVGDYQITGVLGGGGMGQVFQVRNRLSDRVEAMKVILPGREQDLADRFLREIRVVASLDHPNIAALRTALQSGDRILMILEYVEGCSLAERLARGPLAVPEATDCMRQVLAALAFAHSRGVIHRDIKPPNILITPAGVAKLTDFGIARSGQDPVITATGMAVGSLSYMSPEQIQGQGVDARSDLYSLGVTFYEALTGRRPFQGPSEYAIMQAHLVEDPVPPALVNPGIPSELSATVLKAMARHPEQRFQSAEEFRAALSGSAPPPASFDPGELARVEGILRPAMGPIARHLVSQTARQCVTLDELYRRLADQIPENTQRTAFLKRCEGESTGTRTVARPAPAWDPAILDLLKKKLAASLGPLARVMVERQAGRARSLEELYARLAAEIPSERERQAFLSSLPTS